MNPPPSAQASTLDLALPFKTESQPTLSRAGVAALTLLALATGFLGAALYERACPASTDHDVDVGMRSAWVGRKDRGANGFRFSSADKGFVARDPGHERIYLVSTDGVVMSNPSGTQRLHLRLEALNGRALDVTHVSGSGHRVELCYAGLTEWYAQGPHGLEQGFVIEGPIDGAHEIRIEVAVLGASHRLDTRQATVSFAWSESADLLVSDGFAWDQMNRRLPTAFESTENGYALRVGTQDAAWPIRLAPGLDPGT